MSMGDEYRYHIGVEGDWASINPKTLQSKVQIYFQSRKKSRGGDCVIKWTDRSATVYFKSELIRDDVLSKNDHEITIDSQTLKLKVSKPSSDTKGHKEEPNKPTGTIKPELQESEAVGPDESLNCTSEAASKSQVSAVVLKNLPDRFNREFLLLLVGSVCNLSEDEFALEFIPELSTAVVTFNTLNIVEKFLTESRKKKTFQENGVTAQVLEESKSVKVENLPDQCNHELLELYFEKWGGEVKSIAMIPGEQAAIVTFEEQDGVEKILGKQHHFQNTPVSVYPYFNSLGITLYGKDRPTFTLPQPFTKKIHPSIREFLHKKGKVQFVCNQMDSHFCQVNMDKDEVLLSPLPSLLRQKGITKKLIDGWQQNTTDTFKSVVSNFAVFEYSVTPSLWSEMEKDIRSTVKDKAVVDMDGSTGRLALAGMAQDIEILRPILEDLLKKVSVQLERENSKTSENINIAPGIFYLLQQEGLEKDASAKYPELELTYKKATGQVTLVGLPAEIAHIKCWILEKQYTMIHKTLKMDPSLVEFMRSADWEEMSGDLFISKNISAVCRFEQGDLVLTGINDKALIEAEKKLEMTLTFKNLPLEDVGVIEKPEWKNLTDQLCDMYSSPRRKAVLINFPRNRDEVIVCGFREPVIEISKHLENFITTHSRIDKPIRTRSYAVVKFIQEKKKKVWENLLQANEVKIIFDPKRPLIRVSGERIHVQPALEFFQTMVDTLHTDKMSIKKAGAKKYFQEQGAMVMALIKEHRFVVVLEDGSMEDEGEDDFDSESRVKDFGQPSCKVQTPSGITITVRIADMCQLKVDAVVNAANEDLQHIGGLALALLNAAGQSLQECSNRFIAENGKLNPGQAIVTEAGRLPCKYVVHAVGPRYSSHDKFTSVKILRQAVRESLNQAALNNCTSIAVPAISSGIFGFPLDLCAETIAKELLDYTQSHRGGMKRLREIHLVDNNPKTVNAMAQAVKKEFADFNPQTTIPQQMGSYGRGASYDGRGNHGDQGRRPESDDPRVYRMTDDETMSKRPNPYPRSRTQHEGLHRSKVLEDLFTQEGLKIILREGNIQDALSDVIVNTVSESLDLSQGAVSNALLLAAGPQMQTEADRHLTVLGSSKLSFGDMVITDGYNLKCEKVCHVVCPSWNEGAGSEIELFKRIIQECLKKTENWKMASISFPAIGTGNLKFPKDFVSKVLLSEVHAFSARVCPRYLNEVTVIVHPKDNETVQCFIKSFKGGWKEPITAGAQAVQQLQTKKVPAAKSLSGLFGMVSTPTLGVHQMQIGNLTLEVSSGDITKEKCDAIVNSSDQSFTLKAGVSKAILDGAGPSVEQECAVLALASQQKEMIITSAGQLLCKKIIHIVGRNKPADIKDIVYAVLKLCEEQKFASVAFPALGTGQGRASPSAVADAMIDAVIDFVRKKKRVTLQSVKFLIFQTPMVTDFHQSMLRRQQQGLDEQSGVMGWIKDKIDTVTTLFFGGGTDASANKDFEIVSEEFEPVVFQLCAESEQDLTEARNFINSLIMREHVNSSIQDSVFKSFGPDETAMLREMQRELTVSLHLSKKGPEPEITVEGLTRDVVKAESRIRDMIRKVEKKESRQRDAFLLSSRIEWQHQVPGMNFIPFDILTNYDLEEAHQMKKTHVTITINNVQYKADISQNMAFGKSGIVTLKRTQLKEQASVSLPSHWDDMKGSLVVRVTVQPGTTEYADVEKEFRKTGLASNIVTIERIQNDTLWKNYMNQKAYMDKKNNHTNNERQLFHGTGPNNIDKINDRGFNRSYAGMNGAMYGNGVYFAINPCYSVNYAKADLNRQKRMYLARVLVGESTSGKQGLLAPPARSTVTTDLYDSVTDNQQNPTMFVIFHDVHAYPEYLITFL